MTLASPTPLFLCSASVPSLLDSLVYWPFSCSICLVAVLFLISHRLSDQFFLLLSQIAPVLTAGSTAVCFAPRPHGISRCLVLFSAALVPIPRSARGCFPSISLSLHSFRRSARRRGCLIHLWGISWFVGRVSARCMLECAALSSLCGGGERGGGASAFSSCAGCFGLPS